jgi:hypothetical protein
VYDYFSIGVGIKLVTAFFQPKAQFTEIVYFAIENDPDRPIFAMNRLVPCGKINDAKAAHAKRHVPVHVHTLVIRTAVCNHITHVMDFGWIDRSFSVGPDYASNSTHGWTSPSRFATKLAAKRPFRMALTIAESLKNRSLRRFVTLYPDGFLERLAARLNFLHRRVWFQSEVLATT